MRITQPGQARAYPFDRNPTVTHLTSYLPGTAPHGATTRFTYTVPANRKAWVTTGSLQMMRITAAAPVGQYGSAIGSPISVTTGHSIASLDNAVGAQQAKELGGQGFMLLAGEVYGNQTIDVSTGGTVDYHAASDIVEFDA